jgi:hypothetical protein
MNEKEIVIRLKLSPPARMRVIAIACAVALTGGTVAYATVSDPFRSGQTLTATGLNAPLNDLQDQIDALPVMPVGTVVDWWRPPGSNVLPPAGFQVCDGSLVTDPASPFRGARVPDLRNVFVRGVGTLDEIGAQGGAESHSHLVDPPAHDHAVSLAHDHPAYDVGGGSHIHRWAHFNGSDWFAANAGGTLTQMSGWDNGIDQEGSGIYPLVSDNSAPRDFYTESSGHTHTVDLPGYSAQVTSAPHDPPEMPTTSATSLPPYTGLLKIIRIR